MKAASGLAVKLIYKMKRSQIPDRSFTGLIVYGIDALKHSIPRLLVSVASHPACYSHEVWPAVDAAGRERAGTAAKWQWISFENRLCQV